MIEQREVVFANIARKHERLLRGRERVMDVQTALVAIIQVVAPDENKLQALRPDERVGQLEDLVKARKFTFRGLQTIEQKTLPIVDQEITRASEALKLYKRVVGLKQIHEELGEKVISTGELNLVWEAVDQKAQEALHPLVYKHLTGQTQEDEYFELEDPEEMEGQQEPDIPDQLKNRTRKFDIEDPVSNSRLRALEIFLMNPDPDPRIMRSILSIGFGRERWTPTPEKAVSMLMDAVKKLLDREKRRLIDPDSFEAWILPRIKHRLEWEGSKENINLRAALKNDLERTFATLSGQKSLDFQ